MKIAVVAGGWHWPLHFFTRIADQARGADLFLVAHRSPELPIVREEKAEILAKAEGPLARLDRALYASFPSIRTLENMGWHYQEEPNTIGDWGFFNQWLEQHDYREYDAILNCHDDTYIRRLDLVEQLGAASYDERDPRSWLILSNGAYPSAPIAYVRGSFEFFRRELLDMIGGRFDLGGVTLTREGKTDSPAGLAALSSWNDTAVPLRQLMERRGLSSRIRYLAPYYRVSPWAVEGERGFLHYREGASWSFDAGIEATELFGKAAAAA